MLKRQQECPYLWTLRGDLIQLLETQEGPPLKEAAASYSKALNLNPNNLEAVESLAYFYDAVDPNPEKAMRYAKVYIEKAKQGLLAMEQIVAAKSEAGQSRGWLITPEYKNVMVGNQ